MEKQFWVDFVEGRIDVPGMLAETEKRPELLDWLTGIADPKFKTVVVHKGTDEDGFPTYTPEELPFDAKMQIEEDIHKDPGGQLGKIPEYPQHVLPDHGHCVPGGWDRH